MNHVLDKLNKRWALIYYEIARSPSGPQRLALLSEAQDLLKYATDDPDVVIESGLKSLVEDP